MGGLFERIGAYIEDLCYVDTALLKILTDAFMGKNIMVFYTVTP